MRTAPERPVFIGSLSLEGDLGRHPEESSQIRTDPHPLTVHAPVGAQPVDIGASAEAQAEVLGVVEDSLDRSARGETTEIAGAATDLGVELSPVRHPVVTELATDHPREDDVLPQAEMRLDADLRSMAVVEELHEAPDDLHTAELVLDPEAEAHGDEELGAIHDVAHGAPEGAAETTLDGHHAGEVVHPVLDGAEALVEVGDVLTDIAEVVLDGVDHPRQGRDLLLGTADPVAERILRQAQDLEGGLVILLGTLEHDHAIGEIGGLCGSCRGLLGLLGERMSALGHLHDLVDGDLGLDRLAGHLDLTGLGAHLIGFGLPSEGRGEDEAKGGDGGNDEPGHGCLLAGWKGGLTPVLMNGLDGATSRPTSPQTRRGCLREIRPLVALSLPNMIERMSIFGRSNIAQISPFVKYLPFNCLYFKGFMGIPLSPK